MLKKNVTILLNYFSNWIVGYFEISEFDRSGFQTLNELTELNRRSGIVVSRKRFGTEFKKLILKIFRTFTRYQQT